MDGSAIRGYHEYCAMPKNDPKATKSHLSARKHPVSSAHVDVSSVPPAPEEEAFAEVVRLITTSREVAPQAVNTTLIELYWQVGAMISRKIEAEEWGAAVVDRLAAFIGRKEPNLRGFTRRNLFRMRQFYEAYARDSIVSPLVAQLPWSHHLIILGQSKRSEEREFYVRLAIQERWSKRELERQFKTALF